MKIPQCQHFFVSKNMIENEKKPLCKRCENGGFCQLRSSYNSFKEVSRISKEDLKKAGVNSPEDAIKNNPFAASCPNPLIRRIARS